MNINAVNLKISPAVFILEFERFIFGLLCSYQSHIKCIFYIKFCKTAFGSFTVFAQNSRGVASKA